MNVDIIDMPPARVAYLRHIGPYGPTIGAFWEKTFWPWVKANGVEGRDCYGISHDDPSITAPDKCRYDACIEVPDDFVAGGQANIMQLPGGRYAVSRFMGTAAEIGDAWAALFRDWIPQSGLQLDGRPCFEHYSADAKYDAETGAFECRLCVPVIAGQR